MIVDHVTHIRGGEALKRKVFRSREENSALGEI